MSLIHQILSQYWGYSRFRTPQEDIIKSVMEGHDTLALLPTGGGKSICFQVPAMAQEGLCIVISPLIALMKDQEAQLLEKGIRAVALISGMKQREIEVALDNCQYGNYKFLYVSPERLESAHFQERLPLLKVNLIAIDEAHCISQWGFDFRPPYRKIAKLRELFPVVPMLALTASATPEVRDDICKQLEMKEPVVFAKSFARSNLSYIVRKEENKHAHLLKVLHAIPGTGIVYVRNRRKTQEIAEFLRRSGISADYYHAGLTQQTRADRQEAWMKGTTRVIVSTNAFGMGINKPDVRSVVHMDLPDDLESYYQEAGRGGRDEQPAYAVVVYNEADLLSLDARVEHSFPEAEEVRRVYDMIGNYLQLPIGAGAEQSFSFDLLEFCSRYRLEPVNTMNCLKVLELTEHVRFTEAIYLPSRIHIPISNIELYRFQVEQARFDHLIKTVLRSYSGLFDQFVRFSETELARRSGLAPEQLRKDLDYLNQIGVLNYLPSSESPLLHFTTQRVESKHVRISKEHLEDRKKRFEARAKAFRSFITERNQCRSVMLLAYFGETETTRCGSCDYCRERNKVELNDVEMEALRIDIFLKLENHPLSTEELEAALPARNRNHLTQVLTWLVDQGELGYDVAGRIYLKRG